MYINAGEPSHAINGILQAFHERVLRVGRSPPPNVLQTQTADDFRGLFGGNVATELGH